MADPSPNRAESITVLLARARDGDTGAMEHIFAQAYGELHAIAARHIARMGKQQAFDATELVGAACAKLLGEEKLDARNRKHFYFLLGRAMHDVLVKHARETAAAKRGGDRAHQTLVEVRDGAKTYTYSVLELQRALVQLAEHDADAAQVVRLRYFTGLSLRDIAETMECSLSTVRDHWEYAKAWLHAQIAGARGHS